MSVVWGLSLENAPRLIPQGAARCGIRVQRRGSDAKTDVSLVQGTLGEMARGLSVDPPEWLPPGEEYLRDSDSSPDTSPPSSPGSYDSPLVSAAARGGTGPRPILRSNSKLLMKALRLSDSPASFGVRPLAESRRGSGDTGRSSADGVRILFDGEVTVPPLGGLSQGLRGKLLVGDARRMSLEEAQ